MAFNKLTDAQDERLSMLAEEAAEIIKCCTKIQRHGYESYNPDVSTDKRLSNRLHLQKELAELIGVMDQMCAEDDISGSSIDVLSRQAWQKKLKYTHHQPTPDDVEIKRRNALWARHVSGWTMSELVAELDHYADKISSATEWGAAVGEYQKNVRLIKNELERRAKIEDARAAC